MTEQDIDGQGGEGGQEDVSTGLGNYYKNSYNLPAHTIYDYVGHKYSSKELDELAGQYPTALHALGGLAEQYLSTNKNYIELKKAFDSKLERLSPEQKETLAREYAGTIFSVPKDAGEYEATFDPEIEDDMEREVFMSSAKELARELSVPKGKINEFIKGISDIRKEAANYQEKERQTRFNEMKKESIRIFGDRLPAVVKEANAFLKDVLPKSGLGIEGANEFKKQLFESGLAGSPYVLALLVDMKRLLDASPVALKAGTRNTNSGVTSHVAGQSFSYVK